MGTVFLTNLAAVAGKYEQYDILSTTLDFETHNHLPLKSSGYINLKENPGENMDPDVRVYVVNNIQICMGCKWLQWVATQE